MYPHGLRHVLLLLLLLLLLDHLLGNWAHLLLLDLWLGRDHTWTLWWHCNLCCCCLW